MIVFLQYLRAIAAMMVVAFHAAEHAGRFTGAATGFPFTVGLNGVDIFFVISGFIIFVTTRRSGQSVAAFAEKRLVRIVPIYWALTLFVANVAILKPDLLASTRFDGAHLLASLFFVPWPHPLLGADLPVLIPGWTLNYEMAFYALFAACLALPARWRLGTALGVLVLLALLGLALPTGGAAGFYTNPIILEFGAGLLLGRAYGSALKLRAPVAAALAGLGFVLLFAGSLSGLPRIVSAGIPAAMIVAGTVFYEKGRAMRPMRALLVLGDASYSIYLSHVLTLPAVTKLWIAAGLGMSGGLGLCYIVLAMAAAALGGVAVFLMVERPLLLLLRRDGGPKTLRLPPDRGASTARPTV